MAGFAIMVEPGSSPQTLEADFQNLMDLTGHYKQLKTPSLTISGKECLAAKLDSTATIHPGVIHDNQSGSWLLAAGTVVALTGNNEPNSLLRDLLQDYLKIGSKALDRYDGHFALVIYDRPNDLLSIISDPMGFFSIFYSKQGNKTFISTSALAIAKLIKSEPDILTIESFLRSGMVHGELTFWQDVKRLLPATIYTISDNKLVVSEYWAPNYDENITRLNLDEAMICADEMIKDMMARILSREGKVLADLTGGFDSRVTSMYIEKVGYPFVTYSVGPENHPDVLIPRLISKATGWEYQYMPLPDNWSEIQFDWLQTALNKGDARLSVASLAGVLYGHQKRSLICKTNVTGLGVDEWREIAYLNSFLFNWGKDYAFDRLIDAGILGSLPTSTMRINRETLIREGWKSYLSKQITNYSKYPNYIKSHIMFIRYRYPSHGGAYLSAASGILRSISPFCFKLPVNFALSLPHQWRFFYQHTFIRSLLERENPKLANIETANGGPAVPMKIRNLHRFWPLWSSLLDKNINRVSQKVLHKSTHIYQKPQVNEYPLKPWRITFVQQANADGFFTASKMNSGNLYQAETLRSLVNEVEIGQTEQWSFLERVITVEMAMRTVGSSIA
jgi:hypothetical protein